MLSTETEIAGAYQDRQVAAEYVERRFRSELQALLHERQVGRVNALVAREQLRRVLEVAPGPARLTSEVRAVERLVCLEYNARMIAEGRPRCTAPVAWIRGNAFALPFAPGFDFVYSFRFIRHFHGDDRRRLYDEIRRVLRPGGWLTFDAVNAVVSAPLREADPAAYPIYDKLYRDPAELREELAAAGFEMVEAVPVQRWFSWQWRSQILLGPRSRLLCRLAIRTLERMRRGPALEWIVTCRRA